MTYHFKVTNHAYKRWEERFGRPRGDLLEKLETAEKIGPKLRDYLINGTTSRRHKKALQLRSGFFFRRSGDAIFVCANLDVVTVFAVPEKFRHTYLVRAGDVRALKEGP